jgi:hypothetical protein
VMADLGSPDKATHAQRARAKRQLLTTIQNERDIDAVGKKLAYGVMALTACLDGVDPLWSPAMPTTPRARGRCSCIAGEDVSTGW